MTIDYYLHRIMRAENTKELDRIAADLQELPSYVYSASEREIIFDTLNAQHKNLTD